MNSRRLYGSSMRAIDCRAFALTAVERAVIAMSDLPGNTASHGRMRASIPDAQSDRLRML